MRPTHRFILDESALVVPREIRLKARVRFWLSLCCSCMPDLRINNRLQNYKQNFHIIFEKGVFTRRWIIQIDLIVGLDKYAKGSFGGETSQERNVIVLLD